VHLNVKGRTEAFVQLHRPLQVITPTLDGDVLVALARADHAFTGRGLHRLIGRHSADGVRRALDRLVGQGIVDVEVVGPSKLYRLNRDHLASCHVIALAQLTEELLARLRQRFHEWPAPPAYAALFGSGARSEMQPDSDIDVFVVRPDAVPAEDEVWAEQIRKLVHDASRWTGTDARVLELSEGETGEGLAHHEPVLTDISEHGIRLHGPAGYLRRTSNRSGAHG
jgi:hypothetical protein